MTQPKKRRVIHRELEKAKNELLNTTKELIEKTIPTLSEGFNRIITGFTKTFGETLQETLTQQIEKKKKRVKSKKEVKDADPK